MDEYGDPDKPDDFKFMFKYSPLHNIRVNSEHPWPATLVTTADQ
jgi:prolyl oligopeptidase